MNKVVYNGRTYAGETLHEADAYIGDALVSDALTVDTFTAVVADEALTSALAAADGLLAYSGGLLAVKSAVETLDKTGKYGAPVWHYRGDAIYGKFYLDNIKRIGKTLYEINTISAVGLLVKAKHYGGIYNGETAGEVIADIIGEMAAYTLDAELAAVPLYGWLPIASRRDNLRNVLFAVGGQIRKDSLGELNIIPMAAKDAYEISTDEIYFGGSVTGGAPATEVRVTEHRYTQLDTDQTETLFEGEAAGSEIVTPLGETVTGVLIEFAEPYYNLTAKNAAILESGVNYAVISSSPSALLTGQRYAHIERLVIRKNTNTGNEPNVFTSSECALVSLLNSELVAERLMAYYGSGKTVETDFVATTQKPGDMVRLTDPFGEEIEGFIADMELTVSAKMKARSTIISGFIPAAAGNYYSAVDAISADGTYTVPAECKGKIRVVLIGGGGGGAAGEKGADGEDGGTTNGIGGAGGTGGAGGAAGKIYVVTLTVNPGETYAVQIGAGGAGAEFGGAATEGGDTTFGGYSSANGYTPDIGYAALLTGLVYAQQGAKGIDGGRGLNGGESDTVTVEYGGSTWQSGATGTYESSDTAAASGGGGGGPAVGGNGSDGADGEVWIDVNNEYHGTGGDGGAGATATAAENATVPGSGGHGGHGGGGGGGGGGKRDQNEGFFAGAGGAGGEGGAGGDGAPGIILVYY